MKAHSLMPVFLLLGASLWLPHCGGTSSGGGDDAGPQPCGTPPAYMDCVDPCTGQMHGPACVNGSWTCVDPQPSECSPCGPIPGGIDCFDPCAGIMHSPACVNGNWICNDPSPDQCPDGGTDAGSDAGCAAIDNLVPVSCTPFPVGTKCDPFGVWTLSYDVQYLGQCGSSPITELIVERGSDGIARVGFGTTSTATLSDDGCSLTAVSVVHWTNPSESGAVKQALTLEIAGESASGQLVYEESGFCTGSAKAIATATKQAP